jgi:hypothetical protein
MPIAVMTSEEGLVQPMAQRDTRASMSAPRLCTTIASLALGASAAATGLGCAEPDPDVRVELDGASFTGRVSHASLSNIEGRSKLSITLTDPGEGEDDGEWFTASFELTSAALAAETRLPVAGTALLVDRVESETGYPGDENVEFSPASDHDPKVLRAWLWHHAWFSEWDGDQEQELSGTLIIHEQRADGSVRGELAIEARGSLPPVSAEPGHEALMQGRFVTEP